MTATAPPTRREVLRLFLNERRDPDPYYRRLADLTIARLGVELAGARVLDLGSGTGWDAAAIHARGATVVAADLDRVCAALAARHGLAAVCADGAHLPFRAGTFDGVYSSNMLEHVPSVPILLEELARIIRPGGWAWMSFTNWYSPWGGHNITPLHLLGPTIGPRVYERLFGPPPKNVPGVGLFPIHIGQVLRAVETNGSFVREQMMPRYYPSQRWIVRVPGLRELATWNCVLVLRRRVDAVPTVQPTMTAVAGIARP
jgi:SAM-dependent methyltransferase